MRLPAHDKRKRGSAELRKILWGQKNGNVTRQDAPRFSGGRSKSGGKRKRCRAAANAAEGQCRARLPGPSASPRREEPSQRQLPSVRRKEHEPQAPRLEPEP